MLATKAWKSSNAWTIFDKMFEPAKRWLTKVNNVLGVSQLRQVLEIWESNKTNQDEEFWQSTFSQFSWVLSQIFASPVIILHEKAYVGGKGLDNSGGQVIDFIVQNQLTKNISLIEIKTPACGLIREEYRPPKVHNPSKDIVGGINQLLSQKHSLLEEAQTLQGNTTQPFISFQPRCILICGSFDQPALTTDELRSFELYRQNSRDIEIITFDELFKKIESMIQLLDGNLPDAPTPVVTEDDPFGDIPF